MFPGSAKGMFAPIPSDAHQRQSTLPRGRSFSRSIMSIRSHLEHWSSSCVAARVHYRSDELAFSSEKTCPSCPIALIGSSHFCSLGVAVQTVRQDGGQQRDGGDAPQAHLAVPRQQEAVEVRRAASAIPPDAREPFPCTIVPAHCQHPRTRTPGWSSGPEVRLACGAANC